MSTKERGREFHLVVYPKHAGDFGGIFMSGIYRTPGEAEKLAQKMASDIERHVDDVSRVHIVWEEEDE